MLWIVSFFVSYLAAYALADCYPGDDANTAIILDLYHGVTSDNIVLTGTSQPSGMLDREQLCSILTNHHNNGINPGQSQTNKDFLRSAFVAQHDCVQALTYTEGYESLSGWQQWAGYHSGHWYTVTDGRVSDSARWSSPSYEGNIYAVQPVRFDSQLRKASCVTFYNGTTCRHGWNQSGQRVMLIIV